jgi:hypothetical protein
MTAAPTGRARGARRSRSTKSAASGTKTRSTSSVLDLIEHPSDEAHDPVIELASPAPPDPRLRALGLPAHLTPPATAPGELRAALLQRLSRLPRPPEPAATTGVVIAVIGIGTTSTAFARRLADDLDVHPDDVVIASTESMSDLSDDEGVKAFRRSCRRRAEPTVVACCVGTGPAQLRWAQRILDRLDATITWAVVDASLKPEDVEHRTDLLGGVDVIALSGIADTVSPAAVLALNIPVGRIGTKPATTAVWTDLLMERLER